MVNKTDEAKLGWYEELKEGMQEINAESVLSVMNSIEEVEGSETQEKVDKLNSLIDHLELTEEEEQQIFTKFSEGVISFKASKNSTSFIRNKLKRKSRLLENRINRTISGGFAEYVRRLRKEKSYSLKDVERMTGISQSYVNRIEKGERKAPSYPIIEKLAKAYGVPIEELLSIAGVESDNAVVQGFAQLMYSTPITVNGSMVSTKEKEAIIELIETMYSAEWNGQTKHLDTINLINIIGKFKDLS